MKEWIPRDGDAFLTREKFIFYVFGYEHSPERVFSFLKYIPSGLSRLFPVRYLKKTWKMEETELNRPEKLYTAQNFQKILKAFRKHFPSYVYFSPFLGKEVMGVPLGSVERIFHPNECLQRIMKKRKRDFLQNLVIELVNLLSSESGVPIEDFGIHGSLALNIHTAESDIDLAVYGGKNFRSLEGAVGKLANEGALNYIFTKKLDRARKHRGRYGGKRFVYNAIRKIAEITTKYGEYRYSPIKPVTFRCRVTDDSEAMFRPAIYKVTDYQPLNLSSELEKDKLPREVVSMIGYYRNVARKGETLRVSGTLERVEKVETGEMHYQVVVGTGTREGEYIWLP